MHDFSCLIYADVVNSTNSNKDNNSHPDNSDQFINIDTA